MGDASYMGDQYQARAELGTWYGYTYIALAQGGEIQLLHERSWDRLYYDSIILDGKGLAWW